MTMDAIRERLGRPDLDDATLLTCMAEAIAALGLDVSAEDLAARPWDDQGRRLVVSCLALPQPRRELAMPEHHLAVGPLHLGDRLRSAWRSLLGARSTLGES
ncbi:hypothetical protein SL003B_2614 [Polymorphum gilvum SL003B-26A1]|uniref:Uncharacterized protein n=2 Tax=Polymorphum TaxID=991903 RepID=F2J495_POLGS|nr:hypothetical protein SL003B_2614 [Polymorphum gilvum SL003B-26A1]